MTGKDIANVYVFLRALNWSTTLVLLSLPDGTLLSNGNMSYTKRSNQFSVKASESLVRL